MNEEQTDSPTFSPSTVPLLTTEIVQYFIRYETAKRKQELEAEKALAMLASKSDAEVQAWLKQPSVLGVEPDDEQDADVRELNELHEEKKRLIDAYQAPLWAGINEQDDLQSARNRIEERSTKWWKKVETEWAKHQKSIPPTSQQAQIEKSRNDPQFRLAVLQGKVKQAKVLLQLSHGSREILERDLEGVRKDLKAPVTNKDQPADDEKWDALYDQLQLELGVPEGLQQRMEWAGLSSRAKLLKLIEKRLERLSASLTSRFWNWLGLSEKMKLEMEQSGLKQHRQRQQENRLILELRGLTVGEPPDWKGTIHLRGEQLVSLQEDLLKLMRQQIKDRARQTGSSRSQDPLAELATSQQTVEQEHQAEQSRQRQALSDRIDALSIERDELKEQLDNWELTDSSVSQQEELQNTFDLVAKEGLHRIFQLRELLQKCLGQVQEASPQPEQQKAAQLVANLQTLDVELQSALQERVSELRRRQQLDQEDLREIYGEIIKPQQSPNELYIDEVYELDKQRDRIWERLTERENERGQLEIDLQDVLMRRIDDLRTQLSDPTQPSRPSSLELQNLQGLVDARWKWEKERFNRGQADLQGLDRAIQDPLSQSVLSSTTNKFLREWKKELLHHDIAITRQMLGQVDRSIERMPESESRKKLEQVKNDLTEQAERLREQEYDLGRMSLQKVQNDRERLEQRRIADSTAQSNEVQGMRGYLLRFSEAMLETFSQENVPRLSAEMQQEVQVLDRLLERLQQSIQPPDETLRHETLLRNVCGEHVGFVDAWLTEYGALTRQTQIPQRGPSSSTAASSQPATHSIKYSQELERLESLKNEISTGNFTINNHEQPLQIEAILQKQAELKNHEVELTRTLEQAKAKIAMQQAVNAMKQIKGTVARKGRPNIQIPHAGSLKGTSSVEVEPFGICAGGIGQGSGQRDAAAQQSDVMLKPQEIIALNERYGVGGWSTHIVKPSEYVTGTAVGRRKSNTYFIENPAGEKVKKIQIVRGELMAGRAPMEHEKVEGFKAGALLASVQENQLGRT